MGSEEDELVTCLSLLFRLAAGGGGGCLEAEEAMLAGRVGLLLRSVAGTGVGWPDVAEPFAFVALPSLLFRPAAGGAGGEFFDVPFVMCPGLLFRPAGGGHGAGRVGRLVGGVIWLLLLLLLLLEAGGREGGGPLGLAAVLSLGRLSAELRDTGSGGGG